MLGIFLAEKIAINHFSLPIFLVFSFLTLFYFKKGKKSFTNRWIAWLPINALLLLFGYQITYHQNALRSPIHFQQHIQTENYVVGTITNIPTLKKNKIKAELATQTIGKNKHTLATCEGKLLLYLNNYEGAPTLNYGDKILLKSKIQPISKPSNPKAFDYSQYLYFQHIHFQSFVYGTNWTILAHHQESLFWQSITKIRLHCLGVLKKHIQSDKEVAIASALVLGYKANLTPELKSTYSETGAIHVLAVSGLHVGIISAILLRLLLLFPFKGKTWNWVKFTCLIIGIWGFALLTGLPPSVKRAAIMFTCLNMGLLIQREVNIYNSLAIAAFLILLGNPYALFEVGFQFSFLAVIGILFFTKRIMGAWSPNHWLLYRGWELIAVSFSAQLAVFPLILYYFHQMPIYFWLSGLFVIPSAWLLMNLSMLLLLLSSFHELLADYLGSLIAWVIDAQNQLLHLVQDLPFHILNGFWISEIEVILFYGVVFSIAMRLLTYKTHWVMMAFSCLLAVSCVQLSTKFSQVQQQQIIIYALNKKSAIDFIDGEKIYALADSTLTESDYIYSIQNNRWATGMEEIIPLNEHRIQAPNLFKKGNILQFYDVKLALVNQPLPKNKSIKKRLKLDYLIVQNNPKIEIADLLTYYDSDTIIFDGSNTSWAINRWKSDCQALGITYQDIQQDGAFTIDLKQL